MLETTQSQIKCTFIFRILPSLYVEGRNGILFNNVDRLAHLIRKIVKADFFEISTPFVEFLSQVKLKSLIFFLSIIEYFVIAQSTTALCIYTGDL